MSCIRLYVHVLHVYAPWMYQIVAVASDRCFLVLQNIKCTTADWFEISINNRITKSTKKEIMCLHVTGLCMCVGPDCVGM